MTLLIISILALLAAPPLYALFSRNHNLYHVLDGFIFITIGGLIATMIMPEAVALAGWWAFVFFAFGIALPFFSERILHHSEKSTHLIALVLGITGLALHAIADGATLVHGHESDHASALALGVVLHRIPIGLTIWWFVRPRYGMRIALGLLGLIVIGTCLGFAFASTILEPLESSGMAMFQAFVAGSLVHVVLHASAKPENSRGHPQGGHWWEGLGNLLGAGLLIILLLDHHHMDATWLGGFRETFLDLTLESAPALLLAYVAAGLLTVFLPKSYIHWISAGRAWKQSMRGVVVGLPLPVCSCGVVPLYHSLIRKGAPPTAAMAFLIATPEIGIDAVLLSLPLLGETMTVVRVVAAGIVALLVGVLIGRLAPILNTKNTGASVSDISEGKSWREKLRLGMVEGTTDLVDHTGPWILAGLVLAAALNPLLGGEGATWIPPGLEVPFFALLGMPLYVCASGATPLIAVFLINGVSPGAALAFLLTGPATNITTFGILSKLHGRKTAILFGLATFGITVFLGYLTNLILPGYQPVNYGEEHHHWSIFHKIALALLILLYLFSLVRRGARSFVGELFSQGGHNHSHDRGHGHDHDNHHDGHDHNHHVHPN